MYARAHPNMIYFTIIAYPETYFNTIFNKICPPYILRDLCPLVHNMPVFADFCEFLPLFRLLFASFFKRIFALYAILSRRIQPPRPISRFSQKARFPYIDYSQAAAKYPTLSPFCAHIYRFDKLIFELARAYFYFRVDFAFSRVYYLIIKSANRRC